MIDKIAPSGVSSETCSKNSTMENDCSVALARLIGAVVWFGIRGPVVNTAKEKVCKGCFHMGIESRVLLKKLQNLGKVTSKLELVLRGEKCKKKATW